MQSIRSLITAHPIITGSYRTLHTLLVIACVLSGASFVYAQEETFYFLTDHLGSVDVVLNEDGEVVERRDYLPYGQERYTHEELNAPATHQGFTGKELDDETGLQYYGARYYDPVTGRFISIDPWEGDLTNPQTLNKYSYTLNNPLKYIDPTGAVVEVVGRETSFSNEAMHTFLRITPDNPQDYGVDHEFSFTIGGTSNSPLLTPLYGALNSEHDLNASYETFFTQQVFPSDSNMTDTQFINAILEVDSRNESEVYGLFSIGETYNCNDYSSTLLNYAGADVDYEALRPNDKFTYGWGQTIDSMTGTDGTQNSAEFDIQVIQREKNRDAFTRMLESKSSSLYGEVK